MLPITAVTFFVLILLRLFFQGCWSAVSTVFDSDNVFHRDCCKHLEVHVMKKHGPGAGAKNDLQSLFWIAAKVTSKYMCDRTIDTIGDRHPDAHIHLTEANYVGHDGKSKRGVPLQQWTNAYGDGMNWGKLASAASEAGNNAALKFRRMPPPAMMKALIAYTVERVIRVHAEFQKGTRHKRVVLKMKS